MIVLLNGVEMGRLIRPSNNPYSDKWMIAFCAQLGIFRLFFILEVLCVYYVYYGICIS